MKQLKGILFVVSGPSGVGKGTILQEVLKADNRLIFSVSATTRKPREGEIEGCHYHFVSEDEFKRMIEEDKFLEWVIVHGNYYGTTKYFIEPKLKKNLDVVLDIDVQGALKVMKTRPESVFIFIAPPGMDLDVLRNRLCKRNTEEVCQIENRLEVAREELKHANQYDYIVFNSTLTDTIQDLCAIVRAERCKTARHLVD